MRTRWIVGLVLVVLVVIAAEVGRRLWRAGMFRRIEPHFSGQCRLIEGPVGAEDITIHPRTGIAYVSAYDRRAAMAGKPAPGAIYAYDLNQPAGRPVNLTPQADVSFQPHGISLWAGGPGREALFVVNHPAAGSRPHRHSIEIFDVEPSGLFHRATLTDPQLVMPNDLVAVALDRFYVTNTHAHPPGWRQTIETYLQRPGAQVLLYDTGGFRTALDGLVFPNGINASADGRTLYVAAVTPLSVRVYDRDPERERLTFRSEIALGTGPDNIEVDTDGFLWIGAHPKLLRVEPHSRDPAELSPAQVVRVSPDGRVDEIYLDEGEPLSGSSVAAVRGQRLLIGQIFGNGFLDCIMGRQDAKRSQDAKTF